MAHRIEDISGLISAGIVVYRRMQETVQTQYNLLHPSPAGESPPLHTYYGEYPALQGSHPLFTLTMVSTQFCRGVTPSSHFLW